MMNLSFGKLLKNIYGAFLLPKFRRSTEIEPTYKCSLSIRSKCSTNYSMKASYEKRSLFWWNLKIPSTCCSMLKSPRLQISLRHPFHYNADHCALQVSGIPRFVSSPLNNFRLRKAEKIQSGKKRPSMRRKKSRSYVKKPASLGPAAFSAAS